MKALFQARRPRLSHRPRARRDRLGAACVAAERLEPRQMLAADGLLPLLEQASTLVMDASMGPNPVVMSKSQVVGTDVKSFVISHVPEGSVVEKWDALKERWVDVSTMPTSSNPQELMRLLSNRYIKEGDTIQWRPKAGVGAAAQQAFEMIGWDDGSELPVVSEEAPSAVQNLAVAPTGVGELTLSWDSPATGDATSYSITMTTAAGLGNSSTTYVTSDTDYTFTGLSPANGYLFSVTASNAEGTSSAAQDSFGQAPIGVDGMDSTALTTGLDGSIWVANDTSYGTVQQIVKKNGVWTAEAPIDVGAWPEALTTGRDGSIWVTNGDNNDRNNYSPPSGTVQQIVKNDNGVWTAQAPIDLGIWPLALTTGLDGSIWAANHFSDSVQQIVHDNGVWTAQAAIDVGTAPQALTTGRDGSIWVANLKDYTVQQIVKNDNGVWTVQAPIGVGKWPWALTTGLDGSIWVANYGASTVQQIVNDNGVWSAQAAIGVGTVPNALTTGRDGSIWVAGLGITVQQIVKENGVWTARAAIGVGEQPDGLTTGLDGSIWVANRNSLSVQQIVARPDAPFALAAVFGPELSPEPSASEMTLSWRPPVIDGGSPVISYTATVFQGTYTQTITTSDTSCVFDGLTLGSGPTYFTVTATNFAGVSSIASHQVDASGNTIPKQLHRGIGITTDGVPATDSGFNGSGNTYSWEAMGDSASGGARSGATLVSGDLAIDIGSPNQPEFTKAAGQDIEVTGSGSLLTLAGAAVNGGQTNQQFTLTFTDGSTATWTQSLSDWCDPSAYANESIISTQPYLNTASGGTDATTNHIYSYGYILPEGKTLKSITLPNNPNVRILGVAFSDSPAVYFSWDWNAYGLVVANNQVPNSQGFDGHGNYYNANYDGSGLGVEVSSNSNFDYMQITWNGATFNLGPAPNHYSQSNNRDGNNNFVQADGQIIDVVSGDFSTLLMIGAAANGSQTDQPITLTFTDGSTTTWTQTFTDWANSNGNKDNSPPSAAELEATNEALVATTTWVNQVGNNRPGYNRFVYGYSFDIPAGKTLASITLPGNRNVGILGMALV
jgi:streptogramin lyase